MPRKNPHAVALGKKGGAAKSRAKKTAARENGAKGGRPVKLSRVGAAGAGQVEVHADARHVGYTVAGACAFVAETPTAARWLKRHGYEYARWELREVFDVCPEKTWAPAG